jgi:hypothetical protein
MFCIDFLILFVSDYLISVFYSLQQQQQFHSDEGNIQTPSMTRSTKGIDQLCGALKQTINTITRSRNKRKIGSIFVFSSNNDRLNHYNNSRKVDSRLDVEIANEVVPVDSLISSYGGIDWKKYEIDEQLSRTPQLNSLAETILNDTAFTSIQASYMPSIPINMHSSSLLSDSAAGHSFSSSSKASAATTTLTSLLAVPSSFSSSSSIATISLDALTTFFELKGDAAKVLREERPVESTILRQLMTAEHEKHVQHAFMANMQEKNDPYFLGINTSSSNSNLPAYLWPREHSSNCMDNTGLPDISSTILPMSQEYKLPKKKQQTPDSSNTQTCEVIFQSIQRIQSVGFLCDHIKLAVSMAILGSSNILVVMKKEVKQHIDKETRQRSEKIEENYFFMPIHVNHLYPLWRALTKQAFDDPSFYAFDDAFILGDVLRTSDGFSTIGYCRIRRDLSIPCSSAMYEVIAPQIMKASNNPHILVLNFSNDTERFIVKINKDSHRGNNEIDLIERMKNCKELSGYLISTLTYNSNMINNQINGQSAHSDPPCYEPHVSRINDSDYFKNELFVKTMTASLTGKNSTSATKEQKARFWWVAQAAIYHEKFLDYSAIHMRKGILIENYQWKTNKEFVAPLTTALKKLHELRILHTDLQPKNLICIPRSKPKNQLNVAVINIPGEENPQRLVEEVPECYIIDYDLASLLDRSQTELILQLIKNSGSRSQLLADFKGAEFGDVNRMSITWDSGDDRGLLCSAIGTIQNKLNGDSKNHHHAANQISRSLNSEFAQVSIHESDNGKVTAIMEEEK